MKRKILLIGDSPRINELEKAILAKNYLGYCAEKINFQELKDLKDDFEMIIFEDGLEKKEYFQKIFLEEIKKEKIFLNEKIALEIFSEKILIEDLSLSWFLENLKSGEKFFYEKAKRIFDIFFASIFLIFSIPLWPIFSLLIFLEDGRPIFLKQKRVGKNGKIFSILKFRTMVKEAEKRGAVWAKEQDERVTRVGRFLRETHLDEIPQLINVLKGDLSLVGPRPERPEFVEILEKKIPFYFLRHIIKPGFTGWAQIKYGYARSIEDSLEKFQYDLYYIKNRSLLLDLKILLQTFRLLIGKKF